MFASHVQYYVRSAEVNEILQIVNYFKNHLSYTSWTDTRIHCVSKKQHWCSTL